MKKTKNSKAFFKSEHKHDNPVLFLDCVCAKISVIYVTTRSVKPPISSLFYNKTPKTQQVVKKANEFFSSHDGTFTPAKKTCLFRFFCKSFCFCKVYNFLNVPRNYRLAETETLQSKDFVGAFIYAL